MTSMLSPGTIWEWSCSNEGKQMPKLTARHATYHKDPFFFLCLTDSVNTQEQISSAGNSAARAGRGQQELAGFPSVPQRYRHIAVCCLPCTLAMWHPPIRSLSLLLLTRGNKNLSFKETCSPLAFGQAGWKSWGGGEGESVGTCLDSQPRVGTTRQGWSVLNPNCTASFTQQAGLTAIPPLLAMCMHTLIFSLPRWLFQLSQVRNKEKWA